MRLGKSATRRGRYFRRIILYLFVAVFASVLVVAGFLMRRSIRTMKDDYGRFSIQLLTTASVFAESRFKSALDLAVRGFNTTAVSQFLYDDQYVAIDGVRALSELRNQIALNDIIHSVYLYNRAADTFVDTEPVYTDSGPAAEIYRKYLDDGFPGYVRVVLMHAYQQGDRSGEMNLVTVIVKDNAWSTPNVGEAIIVNLREEDFLQSTIATNPTDIGKLYILDSDQQVLSAFDKRVLRNNLSALPAIQRIVRSQSGSGTFTAAPGALFPHAAYLVSFVKNRTLGWTILHMTPSRELTSAYYAILANTLLLLAPILAIGLALALFLGTRLYSPIAAIIGSLSPTPNDGRKRQSDLDEITLISRSISDMGVEIRLLSERMMLQQGAARDQLLRKSLTLPLTADETQTLERDAVGLFGGFPAHLVQIAFDGPVLSEVHATDILHLRMLGELRLWADANEQTAVVSNRSLCAFVILPGRLERPKIASVVTSILERIRTELQTAFSAAMSEPVGNAEDVRLAVEVTTDLLRYRTILGTNLLLSESESARAPESSFRFPDDQERNLTEAIRQRQEDQYAAALDSILGYIKDFDVDIFTYVVTRIMLNVIKEANVVLRTSRLAAAIGYETMALLNEAKGVDRHKALFRELFRHFCARYAELEQRRSPRSEVIAGRVRKVVEEHLADRNLDLTFIGDTLRLSQNYLSRLFKDETGGNLTAFIRERRMDHARSLLDADAESSIGEVANACGYADVNYFSYTFRQRFGMSPTAYREAGRKSVR